VESNGGLRAANSENDQDHWRILDTLWLPLTIIAVRRRTRQLIGPSENKGAEEGAPSNQTAPVAT